MFTRILTQIEMKKPPGTPRTASPKCTARRIPLTQNFYNIMSQGSVTKFGGDRQDMSLPGLQLVKVLICQALAVHC